MSSLFHQLYRQRHCYRYHHILSLCSGYLFFRSIANEKKITKSNLLAHPFYPVILTAIFTDNKHGSVRHVLLYMFLAFCNICMQFQERNMMQQLLPTRTHKLVAAFVLFHHYDTLNRLPFKKSIVMTLNGFFKTNIFLLAASNSEEYRRSFQKTSTPPPPPPKK